jgi:TolB-like protein/Tfp pilus assembly protein PilF
VLSWFYELTPAGFKRESEIDRAAPVTRETRRIDRWLMLVALVLIVLLAGNLLLHRPAFGTRSTHASIAVMPFKNLSSDAGNAYFADGIQDEILVRLSKIAALKVISRRSTARYASAPADLRQIASELGVTAIVEGSVQRHGDSARIEVQLIDAQSDTSLWAETYDRLLTDIFKTQSEVARSIADVLQAKLTPPEIKAVSATPTSNADAYDAYLRGIAFQLKSFEPVNLANAATWLKKATEIDPGFALAWAQLARVESNRAFQGLGNAAESCARARQAADNAQRLQPQFGESALATGDVRFMCDHDLGAAEAAYSVASARLPNNADVLGAMSRIEWKRGDSAAVLKHLKAALVLDPRNLELLGSYAYYLGLDRQFDEARQAANRALQISPDDAALIALVALIEQADGNLGAAEKQLAGLSQRPLEVDVFDYQMLQLIYQSRYAEALAALKPALAADPATLGVSIGDYYALLATVQQAMGDSVAARQTYATAYAALRKFDDGSLTDESSGGLYLRAMLCVAAAGADAAALAGSDCKRLRGIAESDHEFALSALDALVQAELLAGDRDAAFDAVRRLLRKPYFSTRYTMPLTFALLQQDPFWAPLRDDPRYQGLARASH